MSDEPRDRDEDGVPENLWLPVLDEEQFFVPIEEDEGFQPDSEDGGFEPDYAMSYPYPASDTAPSDAAPAEPVRLRWQPEVIEGGKKDAPAGLVVMPSFNVPLPLHREEEQLDPAYHDRANTYPVIQAPRQLFELQLTPDMWPSQQGFLHSYMAWLTAATDAPEAFHLATGLSILSTVLGLRWKVEHRDLNNLTSNLFMLLIGDSGQRKSTALQPAKMLLTTSELWLGPHESALAFIEKLRSNPVACWLFDEASALFDMFDSPISKKIKNHSTSLHDGEVIAYSSYRQKDTQPPVPAGTHSIGLIAPTPLSWLREKRLTRDFLCGGIYARFLVFPAACTRQLHMPPQLDPVTGERLLIWLDGIRKLPGPYVTKLSHAARNELHAWLKYRPDSEDATLTGAFGRSATTAKKLALLYHVASLRGPTEEIQGDSMQQAIRLLHYYLLPAHTWVAEQLVEASTFQRACTELMDRLERVSNGILYRSLPMLLGMSVEQTHQAIYALYSAEKIRFWACRMHGQRGAPTIVVTAATRPGKPRRGTVQAMGLPRGLSRYEALVGEEEELLPVLDDDSQLDPDES